MIGHSGSCPTSGGQFKSGAIHLVTRVGIRLILCGAGEVVCESGHCTLGAVAITGGGAVTQGHRSTPAEVIVGVGGQVVFGILDCGRQTVVAVSVGGIVLGHAAAHGFLDNLYAVVRVVHRLGDCQTQAFRIIYCTLLVPPYTQSKTA